MPFSTVGVLGRPVPGPLRLPREALLLRHAHHQGTLRAGGRHGAAPIRLPRRCASRVVRHLDGPALLSESQRVLRVREPGSRRSTPSRVDQNALPRVRPRHAAAPHGHALSDDLGHTCGGVRSPLDSPLVGRHRDSLLHPGVLLCRRNRPRPHQPVLRGEESARASGDRQGAALLPDVLLLGARLLVLRGRGAEA